MNEWNGYHLDVFPDGGFVIAMIGGNVSSLGNSFLVGDVSSLDNGSKSDRNQAPHLQYESALCKTGASVKLRTTLSPIVMTREKEVQNYFL